MGPRFNLPVLLIIPLSLSVSWIQLMIRTGGNNSIKLWYTACRDDTNSWTGRTDRNFCHHPVGWSSSRGSMGFGDNNQRTPNNSGTNFGVTYTDIKGGLSL